MKYYPMTFLLIVAIAIVLNGCSNQTFSEQRVAFAERDQGTITFGVAWPFETGNDLFWEGVELAVSEINKNGGVLDRRIDVIQRDDGSSVTKGLEIAQAFAENEKVTAVIGHRNSYVSIPVSSIYERASILMLSPASSSPELINDKQQFVFRNIASDNKLAQELASYVYRNGHRKMVILYDDDDYGKGLADAFEEDASRLGLDIVDRLSYYSGSSELDQLKFKWESLKYDGIFIAKSNPEGAQLIADLRAANIDVPLFAGNAMDTPDLWDIAGDEAAEGTIIGSFFDPQSSRVKVKTFIDAFRKTYNMLPTQYSAQGYDAVYLLAEAIKRAQSAVPEDIASSLGSIEKWEGVAGFHEFAENGDDIGDLVVMKQAVNGEFQYLNSK